jgi:ElaB/YqjD/DUF883 family membrane-anchored ribosome-binding protein
MPGAAKAARRPNARGGPRPSSQGEAATLRRDGPASLAQGELTANPRDRIVDSGWQIIRFRLKSRKEGEQHMATPDNQYLDKAKQFILEKPFAAVGIAFVFGFLIAKIF